MEDSGWSNFPRHGDAREWGQKPLEGLSRNESNIPVHPSGCRTFWGRLQRLGMVGLPAIGNFSQDFFALHRGKKFAPGRL
jgi:hypothetical protein